MPIVILARQMPSTGKSINSGVVDHDGMLQKPRFLVWTDDFTVAKIRIVALGSRPIMRIKPLSNLFRTQSEDCVQGWKNRCWTSIQRRPISRRPPIYKIE